MIPKSERPDLKNLVQKFPHLKFFLQKTLDHGDLHLLRIALSDDGKVSEEELAVLFENGVPMLLLKSLEDGLLDAKELLSLEQLGIPKSVLVAVRDGRIDDQEMRLLGPQIAKALKGSMHEKLGLFLKTLDEGAKKLEIVRPRSAE